MTSPPQRSDRLPPVFIGGSGRSGTWAAGHLIGADPRFALVRTELGFHSNPQGYRAVLDGTIPPGVYADQILERWFTRHNALGRPKGLSRIVAEEALTKAVDRFRDGAGDDLHLALRRLMWDILRPYARARGAAGWVETSPSNIAAARALAVVFPAARFVHMVRDGRDVAASVAGMPWGPDTIEEALEWWRKRMRSAHRGSASVDSDRLIVVRLEELVLYERDATFGRLVEFLGLAASRPVADHFATEITPSAGHVGRWRKEATRRRRDAIDRRYRTILAELRDQGVTCTPVDPDRVDDTVERLGR